MASYKLAATHLAGTSAISGQMASYKLAAAHHAPSVCCGCGSRAGPSSAMVGACGAAISTRPARSQALDAPRIPARTPTPASRRERVDSRTSRAEGSLAEPVQEVQRQPGADDCQQHRAYGRPVKAGADRSVAVERVKPIVKQRGCLEQGLVVLFFLEAGEHFLLELLPFLRRDGPGPAAELRDDAHLQWVLADENVDAIHEAGIRPSPAREELGTLGIVHFRHAPAEVLVPRHAGVGADCAVPCGTAPCPRR